jgi:hypothetical protein
MDFIERIFGVSPDGGNGTLELLYVVIVAVAIMIVLCELHRHRTSRRGRSAINAPDRQRTETTLIPRS